MPDPSRLSLIKRVIPRFLRSRSFDNIADDFEWLIDQHERALLENDALQVELTSTREALRLSGSVASKAIEELNDRIGK